ncbi:uncharacterized protein VNE69_11048 [Vairimorpha necatrix]|uniref:Uncharacterized protein n=1 Tax=Vairimorpha necatrix TaxID=6039 RepID=A0AAX4JFZ3_9MICR
MVFLNFFTLLSLSHGCQRFYDKLNKAILNKIENRDYNEINTEKTYLIVNLLFDAKNHRLNGEILIENPNSHISEEDRHIKVECYQKSIQDIVDEFDDKLILELKKINTDFIVLKYGSEYHENFFFEQIICFFNQKHLVRKNKNIRPCITYEMILEDNLLWIAMFEIMKKQDLFREFISQNMPIIYIKKKNVRYINFCITIEKVYYIFEINVDLNDKYEFYSQIKVRSEKSDEIEEIISKCIHKLYKNVYIDDLNRYSLSYFDVRKNTKIEFISDTIFFEIENDTIYFAYMNDIYVNYRLNKTRVQGDKDNSTDPRILQFKDFFEKIFSIENSEQRYKGVEMFFRLIECTDIVNFFLKRILSNKGSLLNAILGHIMLFMRLIKENQLEYIITKEKINELQLIKELEKILSKSSCNANIIIIKICIFMEAEKYINEHDFEKFPQFKILNRINNLIDIKENAQILTENNQNLLSMRKTKFDLFKIYEEVVRNHLLDYENFKKNLWKRIFCLVSLFTGLEKNECKINDDKFYIYKDEILCTLIHNVSKVERNNKIIRKKLFENARKRKTMEEINKILQKLFEKYLAKKLNNLKDDALNKKNLDLYDEEINKNFGNELIQRGTFYFEKSLHYESIKIEMNEQFNAYWNKEYEFENNIIFYNEIIHNNYWIEEYKFIEKEKFCHEIKLNISKNLMNNSQIYLEKALRDIFYNEINGSAIKEKCENNLNNILAVMSQTDIIEAINVMLGMKFHNLMAETLKNYSY